MPDRQDLRDHARAMRHEPTDAERVLWRYLRNGQVEGLKFRRQCPIGDYIADFACLNPRIIVECDGGQHLDNDYDGIRDAWFAERGFLVLRFWNPEVIENPQGVVETIASVLLPLREKEGPKRSLGG